MTKTNTATKTAEKTDAGRGAAPKGKKVLTAKDIAPNAKSDKQIRKELEREIAREAAETGTPRVNAKTPSGMARGVNGQNSPQSSKALSDERAKAKASNKADKAQSSAKVRTEAKKVARAAKAAPKADDDRQITILQKDFTFGREGSARNASWVACTKSKTVADYAAKGGALKYLPRWVAAGAVKLG